MLKILIAAFVLIAGQAAYDNAPTAIRLVANPTGAGYVPDGVNAAQAVGPQYDNAPTIIPLCAISGSSPVKYAACPASGTIPQHTPASSAEACTTGQVAGDTSFLYSRVAPNTWKRVALNAF